MPAIPGVASSSNRAPPRGRAFGNGSDPSGRSGETPPPSTLASRPLRSSRGGPRRQSAAYSRATDSLSWRTGDLLVANVDASGRCTASSVAGRCGVPGQTSRWARFSSTVATNCDAVTRNCSDGCWHDASFPRVARGDGGVVAQKWNKCFTYEMRWYDRRVDFLHPVEAVIPGAQGKLLAVFAETSTALSVRSRVRPLATTARSRPSSCRGTPERGHQQSMSRGGIHA